MTFTELFLIAINLFLQCSPIPVIMEIHRKRSVSHDHDPWIFIVFFINGIIQITYGILIWQSTIIITQILGIVLSIIYLLIFYVYANLQKRKIIEKYLIITTSYILIELFFISKSSLKTSIRIAGLLTSLSTILVMTAPLSTIQSVIRQKNSIHLPKSIVIAGSVNSISWLFYGITVHDFFIWSPNIIGILSSLIQITLLFKYPSTKIVKYQKVSSPIFTTINTVDDNAAHTL